MRLLEWLRRRRRPALDQWGPASVYVERRGAYAADWHAPTMPQGVPMLTLAQRYRGQGGDAGPLWR